MLHMKMVSSDAEISILWKDHSGLSRTLSYGLHEGPDEKLAPEFDEII